MSISLNVCLNSRLPNFRGGLGQLHLVKQGGRCKVVKLPNFQLDDDVIAMFYARAGIKLEAKLLPLFAAPNLIRPKIIQTEGRIDCELEDDKSETGLLLELLPGETAADLLETEGPFEIVTALKIIRDVAEALELSHRQRVIHDDLKPDNIFVVGSLVKKSDFDRIDGFIWSQLLARGYLVEAVAHEGEFYAEIADDFPQLFESFAWEGKNGLAVFRAIDTKAVLFDFGVAKEIGQKSFGLPTPYYMAPERILGRRANIKSEIYALGLTLFELLTGNRYINLRETDVLEIADKENLLAQHQAFVTEIEQANLPFQIKALLRWLTFYNRDEVLYGMENRPYICFRVREMLEQMIKNFVQEATR
ncbi:MAG: protein kinase [bacterium]